MTCYLRIHHEAAVINCCLLQNLLTGGIGWLEHVGYILYNKTEQQTDIQFVQV
jgi:hypothetical protein